MSRSSEKESITFVEISSGVYQVKESLDVVLKAGTFVTSEVVVTYLNSNSKNVVILDNAEKLKFVQN